MKVVYKLAKNAAELDRQIVLAIESANTMKNRVQVAAVSILNHAFLHGDYTRAAVLVDGLGAGINGTALVEFFVKFGGLVVDAEEGGFSGWKGNEYIKENFDAAKAQPWFELKPVSPWAGYNLEDELTKLINKHTSMLKKIHKLEEDDDSREKFSFEVSDATITAVVSLCGMEAVVAEADEEAEAGEPLKVEAA